MENNENPVDKLLGNKQSISRNPVDELLSSKKKVESTPLPSSSQLPSEGGTSGLTATPSVSTDTPTETYTVKQGASFDPFAEAPKMAGQKTALGNTLTPSTEMKAITTTSRGEAVVPDSKIITNTLKTQKDAETKSLVDKYELYKQSKSAEQVNQGKTPFALDDNKNTIDFYMSYLKENNPEEYNYTIQKQAALSKDKEVKTDLEDIQEDDLMIQKFQAETLQKALGLKSRIMSGKYDVAANVVRDQYGDVLKDINGKQSKVTDLETQIKGIDDYINSNFQKDENGQIITTPQNRKIAEDLINKRNEFISQYEGVNQELEGISQNKDFTDAMSLLDETEKTYDAVESMYRGFMEKNPEVLKGLPEYKKQVEKEKAAQQQKDLTEAITGGDLGIGESIGRGATSILSALSFIPKSLSGNDDYGWTDKVYDVVKSNVDDFDAEYNPLPKGYDKPVKDSKTGEWNLQYLPGKIAGTLTEMAPIIAITAMTEGATAGLLARAGASGELGTALGAFAGEYVAVADDFYTEAKAAGMSEKEAMSFARGAATTQAVLGAIYPDIKLARANAVKSSYKTYVDNIAKGVTKTQAVKEASKDFAEKLLKEVPQENLQTVSEIYDKNEMYRQMGLNDKIQNSVKDAAIETTILSSIVTLGLGANGLRTPSRMQEESLYMAANEPDALMQTAQSMLDNKQISQEQFDDVVVKVQKASVALSKIDKTLPAEKKAKLLVPMIEKMDLKEEAVNLDDSQKGLMNEKIAEKDNQIQEILTSPSDQEQEEALNEEEYLKSIQSELEARKKPKVEIPESENKMQREGLFEVDDTQKAQPIELPVETTQVAPEITTEKQPAQETKKEEPTVNVDDKIAEVQKKMQDNKQNFFNEKISYIDYRKNNDALEADLKKLESGEQVEQPKIEENVNQENIQGIPSEIGIGEKPIQAEPIETTSAEETTAGGVIQAPEEKVVEQALEEKKPTPTKTQAQISAEQTIDEEEETEQDNVTEDAATVKKMDDDVEVLKGYNKDKYPNKTPAELKKLIEDKYVGVLARAYKAKIDGKISGPTYTAYRNELNKMMEEKLRPFTKKVATGAEGDNIKKGELKAQVVALGERVKEKLLGEGYKNLALSSAIPGASPEIINKLVDLTVKGVNFAIDTGYGVREATQIALDKIKTNPVYKKLYESGNIDETKFRDNVESELSKAKAQPQPKADDKQTQEQEAETGKEVEAATETGMPVITQEDITKESKGKRKQSQRREENTTYDEINKMIPQEASFYAKMDQEQIRETIRTYINELEASNMIMDAANLMLDENAKKPMPPEMVHTFNLFLVDRMKTLAKEVDNPTLKQDLLNKAARLRENNDKNTTTIAKSLANLYIHTKEMMSSPEGVQAASEQRQVNAIDSYLNKKQKTALESVAEPVNSLINSEEFAEEVRKATEQKLKDIAEKTKGKDWVSKVDAFDDLITTTEDC
jgi:hypothetical protein